MSGGTGISFHRDTVTVIRASHGPDRYGDQSRDWMHAPESDVKGCRVIPAGGGKELIVERDEVVRRWTLFAPADADILPTDRIRYGGDIYEIDGQVRRWRSATGRLAHLECDLLRVEG